MNVLVADDDVFSRELLSDLLPRWGYRVRQARDGAEAWDALQEEGAPRLALLDWLMPGMEGVQVCRKVRENPATAGAYLLLLTCRDDVEDVVLGLDAGANDYLTKPFHQRVLRARVQAGAR